MRTNHYRPIKKIIVVIKLVSILMTCCLLQASARTVAQNISLSIKNGTIITAFDRIEKQAGVTFFASTDVLKIAKPVTVNVKNKPLEEVLEIIFRDQPVSYVRDGKIITLEVKVGTPDLSLGGDDPRPLLEIPPITVRGRIVNENGEPVVASVMIKGTNRGTTSNANGEFELNNVDEDAVLIITATNIETTLINAKPKIDIAVKTTSSNLDEVIVNKGYYTTSRRLNTGNVSRVSAKEIERQPVANPLQAIQGRMAGVYVQQTTGLPGGGFNISIRGLNSLRNSTTGGDNGNLPLYIIDGVPFSSSSLTSIYASNIIRYGNPLSVINPADIQNIEVLKDADATSIYGSRGANGVVLITTKKANAGKGVLEVNLSAGAGKVPHFMDLLDTHQYTEMRLEAIHNDGLGDFLAPEYADFFPDIMIWDTNRYTNWQKELIGGTAHQSNAQISYAAGSKNTQFVAGVGYFKETTVFPGDFADEKFSTRFNVNHHSTDGKLNLNFAINYSVDNNKLTASDLTSQALTLPPVAPEVFDENGKLNWPANWDNPLAYLKTKYNNLSSNLIFNSFITYKIFSNLTIKANIGYNIMDVDELNANPKAAQNPANFPTGISVFGKSNNRTWIVEPQIEYAKNWGRGKLTALAGSTFQQNKLNSESIQGSNYTNDALIENIFAAPSLKVMAKTNSDYRYNGVFGRVNYNWNSKYIINLTGRRDGSSRFGAGKQFANFGAVGLGWIFSNEGLLSSQQVLSFGKFRASYGTTGSDQIPNYGFLDTYEATTAYNGISGLVPVRIANPDYRWEINKKFEAGIDLGFFNDKLYLTASYYSNRSSNQLVGYPLSVVTGQQSVQYNLPATVENKGWEFEINTTNIKSRSLTWTTSLNATVPRNKLVSYPNIAGSSYADIYQVGQSLGTTKQFRYLGVDPETGLYNIEDVNEDGSISSVNDRLFLKERKQNFYGGLINTIQWKNFQFDFLFQFVDQSGFDYLTSFLSSPGNISNQPVQVMNRWQKTGDNSEFQKFSYFVDDATNRFFWMQQSNRTISSTSFIRLKNASVSYLLDRRIADKLKVNLVRLYIQGQNLLTFTNFVGLDPESSIGTLPPLRMITAGLQVKF